MLFYHYRFFIAIIIFTIISFIFLHKRISSKKITLVTNLINILFSLIMIVVINKDFVNLISREYVNNIQKINTYFNIIYDFNITFFSTSLIITIILFVVSKKIKYESLYVVTIVSLIFGSILLFCFNGFIITKDVVNFGMLAQCLSFYYMCMSIIPLLVVNIKNNKNKKVKS